MIKKILTLAMLLVGASSMFAQQPQQLPLDPNVRAGKLDNGLTYYIRHNEEPKQRANFYIAQKVGSTLETQEQLGLAHFLEHMAFNGTTTYPGKAMLNYLETKGIRFGADINAYTDFDKTVYNVDNVPTTDKPLMDSVLLVLRDWSSEISLLEAEIDAERNVIQEEWRYRNDVNTRRWTAVLPKIFQEYQYQQMPIGKMEVILNFPPQALRDYYEKWYRPDQQGIVIVGDFDVDEMETKVKDLFSKITMPENAAERTYAQISDNEKTIYAPFQDPEEQYPLILVFFKYDKIPDAIRNTDQAFAYEYIIQRMISSMINTRLTEYAQNPDCKYIQAGCYFGDYFVAKTKGAFTIQIVAKGDDSKGAMADAMAVIARACKTGFTEGEIERARDNMLSSLEQQYNERDKRNTASIANEIISHFTDNDPMPGIEIEKQLSEMLLQALPVESYNEVAAQLLTPNNQVIVESSPTGYTLMEEAGATQTLNDALNAQYEALQEEKITEPLIANLPAKGSVKATSQNAQLGTTEFKLSNGVKVVIKPTDFSNDEIQMTAYANGGKSTFNQSQAADVMAVEDIFDTAKKGPFDVKTMRKYMSGKRATLGFSINNFTNTLGGYSTVKDLPVLMELIYTAFTAITPDKALFDVNMNNARNALANVEKNPDFIFSQATTKTLFGDNAPLQMQPTVATIDAVNFDNSCKILKQCLSNAAEYTFIFTGNVDEATIRPLLEQYIATLPAKKVKKAKQLNDFRYVSGQVQNDFIAKAETPSVEVTDLFSGLNVAPTLENSEMLSFIGQILQQMYTASLREELGGTYGASTYGALNWNNGQWFILYSFKTNAEKQQALRDRAYKELMDLLSNGADPEKFQKVKEATIAQLDIKLRDNSWWDNALMSYERGLFNPTENKAAVEGITLEKLNAFMKSLYDGKNRIEVMMTSGPDFK